ncbi:porin family protein [Prevotella jejuni]
MKKILVVAALMLSSVSTFAQHAVGSFNLQPKVGVSIANLTELKDTDPRVGVVAGVEGEYQASDIISVSAGVLYSMQGSKYEYKLGNQKYKSTNKLDYINVPIMANVYVTKGLAVKLGVQPGFNVSSSNKQEVNTFAGSGSSTFDVKAKSVDFSIPVGLSYEYNNFQLDARYNWGLTKAFENGKAKNSVFQITLGYKFDL